MTVLKPETEALEARDLIVFNVFEADGFISQHLKLKPLNSLEVESLREKFAISDTTFAFLLIGKDGGVKRQSTEVVSSQDLYAQIDAMPMRIREMNP